MDNLERMYRHLVRVLRSRFPQYLTEPFDVATLQSTILPYRLHRRELGLESNDDYEITLTELLSGKRDYLVVDESMRETLGRELAAKNPDPSAFKQFSSAMVSVSPAALRSLAAGPDDPSTPLSGPVVTPPRAAPPPPPPPRPPAPPAPPMPSAQQPVASAVRPSPNASTGAKGITPAPGERCRACNETLPAGKLITFCPHCGQNVTTMNCPACGSELELGWKFCPVCGRPTSTR